MQPNTIDQVFQSYGRCCKDDTFFIDFYDHFMSSSEVIKNRFAKTDMASQRHLLRNGIMQLILHARGMSDRKLKALGQSHSRVHYDIKPEWYNLWLDALMKTVSQYDPEYSPDLGQAWKEVLTPGINLIRGAY